jgi:RNA polymerase sigma factor (sigma-70 family)
VNSEERFRRLFADHHSAILAYLQRRTTPHDAADVAAEVFVVAWRRLDTVPEDGARLWLFGVAHRTLANHRRGDRRRANLVSELADALRIATQPDEPSPVVVHVRMALAKLPAADRDILTLAIWEELSAAEIAVITGSRVGAVRTRLHRARRRLRAALEESGDWLERREVDAHAG